MVDWACLVSKSVMPREFESHLQPHNVYYFLEFDEDVKPKTDFLRHLQLYFFDLIIRVLWVRFLLLQRGCKIAQLVERRNITKCLVIIRP